MNQPKDITNVDWVNVRAKCTPAAVFRKLLVECRSDVEKRSALLSDEEKQYAVTFTFFEDENVFVVSRSTFSDVQARVTFTLRDYGIEARCGQKKEEATLTLSNEGECKLLVNGNELNGWQFRKMMLEGVLFDTFSRTPQ
jgi:hypothetical protein